ARSPASPPCTPVYRTSVRLSGLVRARPRIRPARASHPHPRFGAARSARSGCPPSPDPHRPQPARAGEAPAAVPGGRLRRAGPPSQGPNEKPFASRRLRGHTAAVSRTPYADGRAGIDAALVARLIARQFPQWSHLPVTPVEFDGHDNRTYRLGTELTVRLPTAEGYVAAVEKENRWLPVLAPSLPVPVPEPVAVGEPGEGYPYPWSVRRWLDGEVARPDRIADMAEFA